MLRTRLGLCSIDHTLLPCLTLLARLMSGLPLVSSCWRCWL